MDAGKGLIFNIQKFSVHDGPGIRTTVFMKGCPLHCLWCSNPESQSFLPELLVREVNCKGCGACVGVCPQRAISLKKKTGRIIDRQKCDQCLLCVQSCLYGSLIQCGQYRSVTDVLDEVLQDKIFYKNSAGGVTISGGEPLSQSRFVGDLLAQCKKEGVHTTLETAGHCSWNDMEKVLRFVDLILFDIKHLDSGRHLDATGLRNNILLENLQKAARRNTIWLRVPLMAAFNDSAGHIKKIAALGKDIGAQKISLLPYHEGGKSKCRQLGVPYGFPDGKAPADRQINKLKKVIEQTGMAVSIGN
ncbi:MAG: glycyl-radical enzyme activating protein [Deltaproteobacteria bacterium]|nr:glycyl-radical enzyme activating protein [Deltaproteobacteria bacterium]